MQFDNSMAELVEIDSITSIDVDVNLVDIEVSRDNTFTMSNGIISHNSAAKTILSARDSKKHGVFPLKGKPINVREVTMKKLSENVEFQNIMSILGLKIGVKVESLEQLRFRRIVPLTDQDPDGQHISGLFFNMMHQFWPELFELGAIYRMITPLIVATVGKKEFEFFDESTYITWAESNPKHSYKYFKGLGGFNTAHFKKFLLHEADYLRNIEIVDVDDVDALNTAFDKSKADERKIWLTEV